MTDLSTGRKSQTFSVDLGRFIGDPRGVWRLVASSVTNAIELGTKKKGELVVFGRVCEGMSASNQPTTLLHLMFVDPSPRGASQKQVTAIHTALKPIGAWSEGTHAVPDDSAPLFIHVNGAAMRIARPADDGGWSRFALENNDGEWAIAGGAVEAADGHAVAEPGIELPLAMIGSRRTSSEKEPSPDRPVLRPPVCAPVLAVLSLGGVVAQYGPFAWPMLQEHLVRVVERADAVGATLVIRMVVGGRDANMLLGFQYDGTRDDLGKMISDVFADFAAKPIVMEATPPVDEFIPLFAAADGELFVFAAGDGGQSAPVLKLERTRATLSFERLPDGEQIQMALRRVRALDNGMATVEVDRQVVLRIARIGAG